MGSSARLSPPGIPPYNTRAMRKLFETITGHPRTVLVLVLGFSLLSALPVLRIRFDNRPDAFIPAGHPALVAKRRVEEELTWRR